MPHRLFTKVEHAYLEGRRMVVPLVGFPGLDLAGCTVKLAQQNYGEHFRVLKAIAETFEPDVIFPLMDLSVEANALGRYTLFPKEESATVVRDAFTPDDLVQAERINIAYDARLLGYVETLRLMKFGLSSSIIRGAYVTGPYTLAGLIMGADEAAMATVMRPDELERLCRCTTAKILEYVRLLLAAGAQVVCILEPSAVMLGPEQFRQFSSRYVRQISDTCHAAGVSSVYHICGNTMHLVLPMSEAGVDALSLDSPEAGVDLPGAARRVPEDVVIIGNISPVGKLLTGTPADVEREVLALLAAMDPFPNFILGTGCDLPQETPAANIQALIRTAREYHAGRANAGAPSRFHPLPLERT